MIDATLHLGRQHIGGRLHAIVAPKKVIPWAKLCKYGPHYI